MRRLRALTLAVCALALVVLEMPGRCQDAAPQSPKTKEEGPAFLLPKKYDALPFPEEQGRRLYDYYCVLCHGAGGAGDGFNSYMLATPPAKFADPALMAKLTDVQMTSVITKGGKALGLSPLMPSWGGVFQAREVTALVAYIRTLSRKQDQP